MTMLATTPAHSVFAQQSGHLFRDAGSRSRRSSSWDTSGRNRDYISVQSGETVTLLEQRGPGCVTHFYVAMIMPEITDYRDAIIRCYWEGAEQPAVEVPLGDFFGMSHARIREHSSQMITVNPGYGGSHGLNCYLPMPFSEHARITLEYRGERTLGGELGALWFHVDYETYDEPLPADVLHFHARFSQELRTEPIGDQANRTLHEAVNLDGVENYLALDTIGRGQMVGLHLQVNNRAGGWYGEGDDMVFIDGEPWPPAIHGTGTEEIFGGGACPNEEYAGLYTGFHLIESPTYDGLVGMYRWYLHDPIRFREGLRWTVEHGHANNFANGYASVAFWYQDPIAADPPPLPSRADLLPPLGEHHSGLRDRLFSLIRSLREEGNVDVLRQTSAAARHFYRGDWDAAESELRTLRK